jgi:hypothetical protein
VLGVLGVLYRSIIRCSCKTVLLIGRKRIPVSLLRRDAW